MAAPPAKISKSRLFTRRLHVGLYIRVIMMVSLGGIVATLFEQYSVADLKSVLRQSQEREKAAEEAKERGTRAPEGDMKKIEDAFKPLGSDRTSNMRERVKRTEAPDVAVRLGSSQGWWSIFLIFVWFWPLYRHYLRPKPENLLQVERRIVEWPIFVFLLCWLIAAVHYLSRMATYRERYGDPDLRVLTVFAAGAFIFGAFTVYLNLEFTQLYVRKWIARPFFLEHNLHGLKRGAQIGLTARFLLLLFSLATVPVVLLVYIPALFNWDLLSSLSRAKNSALFYENAGILVPLVMTALIACVILIFQVMSMVLYRLNVQRPIRSLIARMRTVASGDLNCKTTVLDSDEIGQLRGHFNLMLDGLHQHEWLKDTFGRYVSREIADKIIESGANLAGEEIEATVLFTDIRGFTALSQMLTPTEVVRFLNAYLARITPPIKSNGGVVNKYIGDAVMAIFSPLFGRQNQNHAEAGVRAALAMRAALADFNATGEYAPIGFGVGLHRGRVVAGNVGTQERREFTVLGDVVNVASRIETQTKESNTDILISVDVLTDLDQSHFPGVRFVPCGPVMLRGKVDALELYQLAGAGAET